MTTALDRLNRATQTILDTKASYGNVKNAVDGLADLFAELTGFTPDSMNVTQTADVALEAGAALNPHDAAMTLRDFQRTAQFHRGIRAAIDRLLAANDERPLRIGYAGCGPYGSLIVPLLPLYSADDVRCHFLEINEQALASCRRLVAALGLGGSVAEYWLGDATRYRGGPFHLVVIEAMQRALDKEPHVAIAANMATQLVEDGILVPERVRLTAVLLDPGREFGEGARSRVELGVVYELDRGSAGEPTGAPATITIPSDKPPSHELWILTQITTFAGFTLGDYDSGLTMPVAAPLSRQPRAGERVRFWYELCKHPHLACEIIRD